MVRWRGDEPNPGCGVSQIRNPWINLVRWQLPTLSRLRSLGHLDLDVICVGQVHARHAEASRRYLLDRRALFPVKKPLNALSTLAGVALATQAVHRDGEHLMSLWANRSHRHGACRKTLDNFRNWFDLLNWN